LEGGLGMKNISLVTENLLNQIRIFLLLKLITINKPYIFMFLIENKINPFVE
jgi:hypothetical protein